MSEDPYADHKLCGFVCAVLKPPPDFRPDSNSLAFGTRCEAFSDGFPLGLRSESGVVLIPSDADFCGGNEVVEDDAIKKKGKKTSSAKGMEIKRRRKVGVGYGSMSVVHQLHVLVMHKCLKIATRVVQVVLGEIEGEFRVAVLVDVRSRLKDNTLL